MNINMDLDKKQLNEVFEALLQNALTQGVTLNFNLNLVDKTPVNICDEPKTIALPTKSTEDIIDIKELEPEEPIKVTTFVDYKKGESALTRCKHCGAVQMKNEYYGACHVCKRPLPLGTVREFKDECKLCGEQVHVKIIGDSVDFVSCQKCKTKVSIKLFNNEWVRRR